MSKIGMFLFRIYLIVSSALMFFPAPSASLEYELLTVLHWDTIGDANPDLAYSFESSHRLEITECTLHQCAYPVVFNTGIYKDSPIWGLKDVCNRYGIAGLGNIYTCSNSYFQACPLAEGQWYAVSEVEIGFSLGRRTIGPVFANCPTTGSCLPLQMATSILPLSAKAIYLEEVSYKSENRLAYTLSRTKLRDGEKFLMDDWAVTSAAGENWATGPRSSVDAFHRAVGAQLGHRFSGPFLVIQEPVHERNGRWVPRPEIYLSKVGLASNRRGTGEVVAVRAELFDRRVEDLQILYASSPVDGVWLKELLKQRIGLRFSTPREHPTVAFLVLRLGEELEQITSLAVLPKCCPCEPPPCIPD